MSSLSISRVLVSVAMVAIAGCSGAAAVDGAGEEGDDGNGAVAAVESGLHASELSGDVGAPGSTANLCAHDLCSAGEALPTGCDPCVDQVCATDSYCCLGAWDSICVSEAESICGLSCPVTCGDGTCEASEDCSTCAQDCGACTVCGDTICNGTESCSTCSQDCGACAVCGDGTCDWTETCGSCSQDCGACVCHDVCVVGAAMDPSCGTCEGQVCAIDSFCCQQSWDVTCVSEAESICGQACPVACGNGVCEAGEDCSTCAQDCGACAVCGDGTCNLGEDCSTCAQDCGACAVCGDGTCDWPENCSTCSQDCGACPTCGDGACDWNETCGTCAQDCGACACHDKCEAGGPLSASCGQCEAQVCAADAFCCQQAWDAVCVSEVESVCGETCP